MESCPVHTCCITLLDTMSSENPPLRHFFFFPGTQWFTIVLKAACHWSPILGLMSPLPVPFYLGSIQFSRQTFYSWPAKHENPDFYSGMYNIPRMGLMLHSLLLLPKMQTNCTKYCTNNTTNHPHCSNSSCDSRTSWLLFFGGCHRFVKLLSFLV